MTDESTRPPVRLADVARRAGCSAATVSRVLNAPSSVNAAARHRVEAAVRDLGYMRNGAARALRSRRSRIVGLVLPTLDLPIYTRLLESLQHTLMQQGYSLIVTTCDYSIDQEFRQSRVLAEHGVDGLVLLGHTHLPELYTLLQTQGVPYVTTYTHKPELGHPSIGFDNRAAMVSVADHLLDLGHRDIAVITGSRLRGDRIAERLGGIHAALAARGVVLDPEQVVVETASLRGGRTAIGRLIDGGHRPTAIICANDIVASGVLIECAVRGIAVPGDLSVVGFDDIEPSAYFDPPLTTLSVPAAEMGRRAGEYLLARFDGRPGADHIALETRLVLRGSTARPTTCACRLVRSA